MKNHLVPSILLTLLLWCFVPASLGLLTSGLTDVYSFNEDNANVYYNNSIAGRPALRGHLATETLSFDGLNGKAAHIVCSSQHNCINTTTLMTGHAIATVCFWYRNLSTAAADTIGWTYFKDNSNRIQANYRAGGAYKLNWYNAQATKATCDITPSPAIATQTYTWRLSCLVVNGTHFRQYFNNTLVFTQECTPTMAGVSSASTLLLFGKYGGSSATAMDLDVDEFMVWNRTVSVAEISALWNNGVGNFYPLFGAGPGTTASVSVVFRNLSLVAKASFKEGEAFRPYANFSLSNGSSVVNGNCNITLSSFALRKMAYNATSQLYRNYTSYSYSTHGSKAYNVSCSAPSWNAFVSGSFAVVNIPPRLLLGNFSNEFGNYSYADNVEYSYGLWQFFSSVFDDDLDYVVYTLRNSTAVRKRIAVKVPFSPLYNGSLFLNLKSSNYFNFSVWANDTAKNKSFVSGRLFVNDTYLPSCTNIVNGSVLNNSYFAWNVSCTDEYLYSFEVSCSNGVHSNSTNIGSQTFNWYNRSRVKQNTSCDYVVCDGHTVSLIGDMAVVQSKSVAAISFDGVTILAESPDVRVAGVVKLKDRYSFSYDLSSFKYDELVIRVPDGCYPARNSRWQGHLLCPEKQMWIDFVNPDVSVSVRDGFVYVDVSQLKDKKSLVFNSVGKFNCVSYSSVVEVVYPSSPYWTLQPGLSTADAIFIIGMFFVVLVLMALGEVFGEAGFWRVVASFAAFFVGFLLYGYWTVFAFVWWGVCCVYFFRAIYVLVTG